MPIQKRLYIIAFNTIKLLAIASILVSCGAESNLSKPLDNETAIPTPINNTACLAMNSRDWRAWIDETDNQEQTLNISGEVDLPTPGYTVTWKSGILDRSQTPTQNLSVSFTPPAGIVIQVITPTKVNFSMPSEVLEYRSIKVYCGEQLLADIPGLTTAE